MPSGWCVRVRAHVGCIVLWSAAAFVAEGSQFHVGDSAADRPFAPSLHTRVQAVQVIHVPRAPPAVPPGRPIGKARRIIFRTRGFAELQKTEVTEDEERAAIWAEEGAALQAMLQQRGALMQQVAVPGRVAWQGKGVGEWDCVWGGGRELGTAPEFAEEGGLGGGLTESSNPTQHAKRRAGDCPGPCKETATRRNVTQGGGGGGTPQHSLRVQVVHHMPRRVSMCVRPNCPTPPRVVLVVHHLSPHAAVCVGGWAAKTLKRSPQQPGQPPVRQLLGSANVETTPPPGAAGPGPCMRPPSPPTPPALGF